MVSLRAGGGFGRGTYVVLSWLFSLAAIPFVLAILTAGVKIAVETNHDVPWWGGDAIVVAQIAVTPIAFIAVSRLTAGRLRPSVAAFSTALFFGLEVTVSQFLKGH